MSTNTWQGNDSCDLPAEGAWFCTDEERSFELAECCCCPCPGIETAAGTVEASEHLKAENEQVFIPRLLDRFDAARELVEKVNCAPWSAKGTVDVSWDPGQPEWPTDHKHSVPSNKFLDLVKRGQAMEANSLIGARVKSNRDLLCVVSIERAPGGPTRMTLQQVSSCTCAFCVRLHRPAACTLEQLLATGWFVK
jgi:hypothetical protein